MKKQDAFDKFISLFQIIIIVNFSLFIIFCLRQVNTNNFKKVQHQILFNAYGNPPLAMTGGDPYIRALMRTITASEANFIKPYNVLYGGRYIADLSTHPNLCVKIARGPNKGKCTTAAGRYQFLNITWYEKASQYHPQPNRVFPWVKYSFEPKYQDAVVYNWLKDSQAWGTDISKLLKQGNIDQVLKLLSNTWTSLGYGIEDNSMTQYLPQIYDKMLQEELQKLAN
jgi:muramidase (phage lysozyme)